MTQQLDAQIDKLIHIVSQHKAKIVESEKVISRSWKTKCSITIPGNSSPINIQTAPTQKLLDVTAWLLAYSSSRIEAAELLGVAAPNDLEGFSIDDWIDDCKKRAQMLSIGDQRKHLEMLGAKLDAIVSPEQRRARELAILMDEIGSLPN